MKKLILSIVSFAFFTVSAQERLLPVNQLNTRDGEAVEYCHQHRLQDHFLKTDTEYRTLYNQAQAQLDRESVLNVSERSGTVYYIPVVFHVLHQNGAENISDAQIFDAVEVLNRDYRMLNTDVNSVVSEFRSIAGDAEIQFRLATIAPDGSCFKGITRTVSSLTNGENGQAQLNAALNNNDVYRGTWDHRNYLNIIVANEIGGAAGYTFLPSNGGAYYNTIFILQNYVGRIGTGGEYRSRSLTHEVGHWLNLKHTWGDGNEPGAQSNCNMDDGVTDTPNTRGVTSCNLAENACGPVANVENYMDYSYCSKMFTQGQIARMRTAITSTVGGRSTLWSAANLERVGATGSVSLCRADFISDKKVVCVGTSVRFTDVSYNNVVSRTWNFPGGTATSNTASIVDVVYTTPGTYSVTLTASNGSESVTETRQQYIRVLPSYSVLPFYDGFEAGVNLEEGDLWGVNNLGGTNKFEITTNVGATGSNSVRLRNFADRGSANVDELVSRPFDLSGESLNDVVLSFKYAFRNASTSSKTDRIQIYLSSDCGDTWVLRRTISNSQLASGSAVVTSNWTASPSDFVSFHLPFNTASFSNFLVDGFRFKIVFSGGTGNNVFIDDINLYNGSESDQPVLNIESIGNLSEMEIYPNPTQKDLNVVFDLSIPSSVDLLVMDITGKILSRTTVQSAAGSNSVVIDNSDLATGSYLLNIITSSGKKVVPFVKL